MAGRRRWSGIVFLAVWLTFWTSAILVAAWQMGAEALAGEPAAAVFLALWVAAAGVALVGGARRLKALATDERAPPRPARNHAWHDGMDDPPA